jgi:hypothetical protein
LPPLPTCEGSSVAAARSASWARPSKGESEAMTRRTQEEGIGWPGDSLAHTGLAPVRRTGTGQGEEDRFESECGSGWISVLASLLLFLGVSSPVLSPGPSRRLELSPASADASAADAACSLRNPRSSLRALALRRVP